VLLEEAGELPGYAGRGETGHGSCLARRRSFLVDSIDTMNQ
jgi:hypothetical protein